MHKFIITTPGNIASFEYADRNVGSYHPFIEQGCKQSLINTIYNMLTEDVIPALLIMELFVGVPLHKSEMDADLTSCVSLPVFFCLPLSFFTDTISHHYS